MRSQSHGKSQRQVPSDREVTLKFGPNHVGNRRVRDFFTKILELPSKPAVAGMSSISGRRRRQLLRFYIRCITQGLLILRGLNYVLRQGRNVEDSGWHAPACSLICTVPSLTFSVFTIVLKMSQ